MEGVFFRKKTSFNSFLEVMEQNKVRLTSSLTYLLILVPGRSRQWLSSSLNRVVKTIFKRFECSIRIELPNPV